MKTARPREVGKMPGGPGWSPRACLCVLLCAGAASAAEQAPWASDTATFTPVPLTVAGSAAPGSLIEISTSNLPRFDHFDGSNRTQLRLDMALLSPGRSSFGVTMGVSGLSQSRNAFQGGATDGLNGVNLGLQWRYVLGDTRRVDIAAWREMGRPNDALAMIQSRDGNYGARVEMKLAGSGSTLVTERGFIGMRLNGGGRITVKRSMGQPMVYYRNQF